MDCIITIEPTEHAVHDCIPKLDPYLHMFCAFQEVPQSRNLDGVFLSSALKFIYFYFTLHSGTSQPPLSAGMTFSSQYLM